MQHRTSRQNDLCLFTLSLQSGLLTPFKGWYLILPERWFEDHEYLVELLSAWSHNGENTLCFLSRPQRFVMFTDPQVGACVPLADDLV